MNSRVVGLLSPTLYGNSEKRREENKNLEAKFPRVKKLTS